VKRKTTYLETYLADYGFKLTKKTYVGKESQFTKHYVFSKQVSDLVVVDLCLNKHRNKIEEIVYNLSKIALSSKELEEVFKIEKEISLYAFSFVEEE
jgi:hypothetical protein